VTNLQNKLPVGNTDWVDI